MILVDVAPGHRLAAAAAASYLRARAAGAPAGITSAYRPPERQAELRAEYLAHPTTKPYAAPVGKSYHVVGCALDLPPAPATWMRAHPGYGFVFTDPSEWWHVAYRADRDQHLTDGVVPPAPIAQIEDDDMTPDQDRMLAEVHAALGAGGAVGLPAEDTVLGRVRSLATDVAAVPTRVWDAPVTADDGTGPQTHSAASWLTVLAFRVRDMWARL